MDVQFFFEVFWPMGFVALVMAMAGAFFTAPTLEVNARIVGYQMLGALYGMIGFLMVFAFYATWTGRYPTAWHYGLGFAVIFITLTFYVMKVRARVRTAAS